VRVRTDVDLKNQVRGVHLDSYTGGKLSGNLIL
jgi:hypothetical protein